LVTDADIQRLAAVFRNPNRERLREFEGKIRHYLAHPESSVCRVAVDQADAPAVLLVQTQAAGGMVEIPFLRHTDHPLAGTLIRHMLHAAALETGAGTTKLISVSGNGVSVEAASAMNELGFLIFGDTWWKFGIAGVVHLEEVAVAIHNSHLPPPLKKQLADSIATAKSSPELATRNERIFAPAKIIDSNLPAFVVSIRPDWAEHFFDIPIGGQLLMDLKEKLHLGIEGAYYCSAQNGHLVAPARVLWYVSKGPSGRGSMSVKACSHLAEKVVGKPKELFRRFRHLGVYAWKHVFETVGNNLEDELLAFRFTHTERFPRPVSLAELKDLGVPQPVNPRRISNDAFTAIYKLGMNHGKK
jgi:hypothetical protein